MSSGDFRHARVFRVLAYVTVFAVVSGIVWGVAYARWRTAAIAKVRKCHGSIRFAPLPEFVPKWAPVPEWIRRIDSVALSTADTRDDDFKTFAGFPLTKIAPMTGFGPQPSPRLSDDGLRHLAGLPLEELAFTKSRITGEGFRHLRTCPLRTIGVSDSPIQNSAIAELANIPTLELIGLHGTAITDAGLTELKALPALKHLHLSWNDIRDEGLAQLAELKLESLSLDCTYVTDAGLRHLTKMPLRKLSLCQTEVTPAGLRVLTQLPQQAT
jgi:hypothetical protein